MLSPSPMSAKSVIFLLGLLYLQVHSTHAAISTSAGFPRDVFAKPAFRVDLQRTNKAASPLPIKRSHAMKILEQQEQASTLSPSSSSWPPQSTDISSLAVADRFGPSQSSSQQEAAPNTLFWTLQRSSPDEFQLCSVPDFTSPPVDRSRQASAFAHSLRPRQELIRNAQALLEPLKKVCLYHTADWFTYSFCHGREIRQFRRLTAETAAHKAFKAAGGGEAGKKAAAEAAEKIKRLQRPVADPVYPAFIIGRWTRHNEDILGDDQSHQRRQQQPFSGESSQQEPSTGVAVSSHRGMPSAVNSAGLDLVEEVQFGDWDEDELFAAEAKALAQFQESSNAVEASRNDAATARGRESQRHRYLTQRWTNGTMCDMNHQPRSVEVQFHCSNRKPLEDRIVVFKETTICNYVLIIETPRLCADPAFGSEEEEAPLPIQCHTVVRDDYAGPTVGDPDRVAQPPLSQIVGGAGSHPKASTKVADEVSREQEGATTSDSDRAQEAATTSHTYGDPSRFGSVHDDFYDEALGGPGAMYQHFHHGHDHDHHHDHDHTHGEDQADIVVEIGLDEDGQLLFNRVSDQASEVTKDTRRRESGKKRSDDDREGSEEKEDEEDEHPLEIQLDVDDLLSVLQGDEAGGLEKKLADKISKVLNKQMQRQHDAKNEEETVNKGKGGRKQTPDDLAKLYQKLFTAVTGDAAETDKKQAQAGQGKQPPPALRMEKVGDSLPERVRRFYNAKERQGKTENADKRAPPPPPIEEHLEL